MVALARSTCEACTEPPEFDRSFMWENITHQEKGGIVSHVATCYIFCESKIPDIEAGLASADRRIDAALDRPSDLPSPSGTSAPPRDPAPLHYASRGARRSASAAVPQSTHRPTNAATRAHT